MTICKENFLIHYILRGNKDNGISELQGKMDVDEDGSSEETDEEPQKKKVKSLVCLFFA